MNLDPKICERARLSRDARFDGRFFVCVTTTGIFCRPICPAPPPKPRNVRFYPTAAAAAEAGFRPCLRCRPETSPGTPVWQGTSTTVSRALKLISTGALDEGSVEELSDTLGVTSRHLSRLFLKHLGASPIAVAQTRRLQNAKKLLDETGLSMTDVALSSGYGSLRRFNAAFQKMYGRPPSQLRKALANNASKPAEAGLSLLLPYRPPFDWNSLVEFLAARATPGVETVDGTSYRRTISLNGKTGIFEVAPVAGKNCLNLRVEFPGSRALFRIVERVKRIFDLDAVPDEITSHLRRDRRLAGLVKRYPGLRVPGAWDGFELAVRAVLGQQISVKAATTLAGRLAHTYGEPRNSANGNKPDLLFPAPETLAKASLTKIGLTQARAKTLRLLAKAVSQGRISFDTSMETATLLTRLNQVPGIGDWTAQYIALRALSEPDAFPSTDLGLLRAASNGDVLSPGSLLAQAEAWRPWRGYAAMYLWKSYSEKPSQKQKTRR